MLLALSCLSSCAKDFCEYNYPAPVFPRAGAGVVTELESLSDKEYPYLWDWIGRLNKLRQELEVDLKTEKRRIDA